MCLAVKSDKLPSGPASKLTPNVMFVYIRSIDEMKYDKRLNIPSPKSASRRLHSSITVRRGSKTGGIILVHAQLIQSHKPQVIFNGGRINVSHCSAATASSHVTVYLHQCVPEAYKC